MQTNILLETSDVNDTSALLFNYEFSNGIYVEEGQVLLEAETSKKVIEISAPVSGYLYYLFAEGDEAPVNSTIVSIFDTEEAYAEHTTQLKQTIEKEVDGNFIATEKAKKLAQKHNLDLSVISKEGIIKESDIINYIENQRKSSGGVGSVYRYDKERIAVVGAGFGAEVLLDILDDQFDKQVVLLIDDMVKEFPGYKLSPHGVYEFADSADRGEFDTVIISLSANRKIMKFRAKVFNYYRERGIEFTNVIAKSAEIRRNVKIGQGNIIGANVYIGTKTVVGDNNAISYNAVIGHHNSIGNCNLLAPGIMTSGSVSIGSECIVPAGVNFINRVKIGDNVVLPVGYNVTEDIVNNTFISD